MSQTAPTNTIPGQPEAQGKPAPGGFVPGGPIKPGFSPPTQTRPDFFNAIKGMIPNPSQPSPQAPNPQLSAFAQFLQSRMRQNAPAPQANPMAQQMMLARGLRGNRGEY